MSDVWLGIESAPRNGAWFYAKATFFDREIVRVVHFADASDRFPIHDGMDAWSVAPTHWRPLLAPDMCVTRADLYAKLEADLAAANARADALREAAELDADLLFDAYKAVLVLHRILDKQGLEMGVKAANEIADRIVKAHPEFPGLTALRALAEVKP